MLILSVAIFIVLAYVATGAFVSWVVVPKFDPEAYNYVPYYGQFKPSTLKYALIVIWPMVLCYILIDLYREREHNGPLHKFDSWLNKKLNIPEA